MWLYGSLNEIEEQFAQKDSPGPEVAGRALRSHFKFFMPNAQTYCEEKLILWRYLELMLLGG